jgi:hypothetical protein
MAFAGSPVTYGTARGLVVATGDATQTGQIAALMAATTALETPLTQRIAALSNLLVLTPVEGLAKAIQLSVAPVFLLAGISGLLGVLILIACSSLLAQDSGRGGLRGANVGAHRDVHADEPRHARQHGPQQEPDGRIDAEEQDHDHQRDNADDGAEFFLGFDFGLGQGDGFTGHGLVSFGVGDW